MGKSDEFDMSLGGALKQWKPPGCARFQRAGFGHGPMKEACTLEACAPRRFPEEIADIMTAHR
jgi:hypothetical protein